MARIGALKLKIQLFCGEELAFGPGRADVLEAIAREGSISAAGRAMGMSYRRTWLLVDSMNRCFREKLVDTASGGRHGGGAVVTDEGSAILSAYRSLESQLEAASHGPAAAVIRSALRDTPLPA